MDLQIVLRAHGWHLVLFEVVPAGGTQPGLRAFPDVDQQAFSNLAVGVNTAVQDLRGVLENALFNVLFELYHALLEAPAMAAAANEDGTIFCCSLEGIETLLGRERPGSSLGLLVSLTG